MFFFSYRACNSRYGITVSSDVYIENPPSRMTALHPSLTLSKAEVNCRTLFCSPTKQCSSVIYGF